MDSAISGYLSAKLPAVTGAGSSATGAATGVAVHQTAYLSFASLTTAISHLTFDSVMELAAEQATINITTQLANIAMGFQKGFDVRSVFDTMAVAVFDAGIQQVVKLPSQDACLQDFGKNLFAATAKGIENIAESYVADAITGTPHHLDDLLESALGSTTGSVLSTYMPVINFDGKKGQSANHAQQSQRPKMTHASNMPDDHNHGADPSYKVAIYTAHGGTSGDLSLPPIPGDNQLAQANALSNLDSNTNRPASSTNNPYGNASGYTKADSYQQALHTAAVGLHTLDTMMHNGMHLLYEAAQQQAAAQPTQTTNALHGGAPGSRVGQGSASLFGHTPQVRPQQQGGLNHDIAEFIYKHQNNPVVRWMYEKDVSFNNALSSSTGQKAMSILDDAGKMAYDMNPIAGFAEGFTHQNYYTGTYVSSYQANMHVLYGMASVAGPEVGGALLGKAMPYVSRIGAPIVSGARGWVGTLGRSLSLGSKVTEELGAAEGLSSNGASMFGGGKGGYDFKSGEDLIHFEKHGVRIANKLGPSSEYSVEQYVADANRVVNEGMYVPELNAYVKFPTGTGEAQAPFVGIDRETNEITTFHLKPVRFLEQRAPSLGWYAKPSSEFTDLIGPDREIGWKPPYGGMNP